MRYLLAFILLLISEPAWACKCIAYDSTTRMSQINQIIQSGGYFGLVEVVDASGEPFSWEAEIRFVGSYANKKYDNDLHQIGLRNGSNCDMRKPKKGDVFEVILQRDGSYYSLLPGCSGLLPDEWADFESKSKERNQVFFSKCQNPSWSEAVNLQGRFLKCAE
jgi:hypothetical protein